MADVPVIGADIEYPRRESDRFDEADYHEWVCRQLGAPTVDVELTEKQISDALEEALTLYSKYKPRHLYEAWIHPEGYGQFTLTDPKTRGIYDIQFQGVVEGLSAPNIEAQLLSGSFAYYGVAAPKFDLRYYEYARQWVKIAQRQLSSEPDYKIAPDRKSVWIYTPGREVRVTAEITMDHVGPDTIPGWGQKWMRDYVLAWCKVTLGRVRGKFPGGFKGAGDVIQLDGDTLLSEGREELRELDEKLARGRAHLAPSWG